MQESLDGVFSALREVALTKAPFLAYILPPEVSFYLMGVLVQLEGTRSYRFALLPLLVWFSWRGAFVDVGDPMPAKIKATLIFRMCFIAVRGTIWALAREPYQRHGSVSNKRESSNSENLHTAIRNVWDLTSNMRGIGWNWSDGLSVPKPTFETDSRRVFAFLSAVQVGFYALCFDACHHTIHVLSPDTFGSVDGGSLFDRTLPPFLELARAVCVAFLAIWRAYFEMQTSYHILVILGVSLFRQRPSQWPPYFDAPWSSTSLTELWGRRWHQMLRHIIVTFGVRPFGDLFGKLGGLLGGFFISGIIHDIELRILLRGGNTFVIVGFWVMNGVGVVLERVWKRATGKRVGGVWGRVWLCGWLVLWGVPMVNEWAKVGRFGEESWTGDISLLVVAFVRRCLGGS